MSVAGRSWLLAGAAASAVVALVHVGAILVGPPAYVYLGAPQLAPLAAAGSPLPAMLTGALALLFAVWGWYALAAAGRAPRPPLLRVGVWTIGAIYAARGLAVAPELVGLARGTTALRFVAFSLVSLLAGTAYLVGAWRTRAATAAPDAGRS